MLSPLVGASAIPGGTQDDDFPIPVGDAAKPYRVPEIEELGVQLCVVCDGIDESLFGVYSICVLWQVKSHAPSHLLLSKSW
jgi:hypothetical protein